MGEVTDSYAIRLSNGDEVESPSRAAVRVSKLATGKHRSINGWTYWRVGEAGPLLADVRVQYLMDAERAEGIGPKIFRTAFWDGFFNYCSDRPDCLCQR